MRKIALFFGKVPAAIKKIAQKVLRYTTAILAVMEQVGDFLESDIAKAITAIIPGDTDEEIRLALISAIRAFMPQLRNARTNRERKRVMGAIGARAVQLRDGQQHDAAVYIDCFEKVYSESKAA